MNFYKNPDNTVFIAVSETRTVKIIKTNFSTTVSIFYCKMPKPETDAYQESNYDEFFNAYDDHTAVMTDFATSKRRGKGVGALLIDAKKAS